MPLLLNRGLGYRPCSGATPGRFFVAPGRTIIAVAYNGILMLPALAAPRLSYTAAAQVITTNFDVQPGDRIDAFCIQ